MVALVPMVYGVFCLQNVLHAQCYQDKYDGEKGAFKCVPAPLIPGSHMISLELPL